MAEDPSQPVPPSPAGSASPRTFRVLLFGAALILVAPLALFGVCALTIDNDPWCIYLPLAVAGTLLFLLYRTAWRAWKVGPEAGEPRWSIVLGTVLGTFLVLASTLTGLFFVLLRGMGMPGRPLRDAKGRPRLPRVAFSGAPSAAGDIAPSLEGLGVATRVRLALEWIEDGRMEHASVGAFLALALDLEGLGAPRSLVERAHAAAREEEEHALLCFALASTYAGCRISAEPLAVPARGANLAALAERVAVESAVDGCIGEEAAATVAERCMARASDPSVRRVLATIARDERSHALLARDVLDWCCASFPHVHEPVARALAAYKPRVPRVRVEKRAPLGRPQAGDRLEAEIAAIASMSRFAYRQAAAPTLPAGAPGN
jgi:hypothetical protein